MAWSLSNRPSPKNMTREENKRMVVAHCYNAVTWFIKDHQARIQQEVHRNFHGKKIKKADGQPTKEFKDFLSKQLEPISALLNECCCISPSASVEMRMIKIEMQFTLISVELRFNWKSKLPVKKRELVGDWKLSDLKQGIKPQYKDTIEHEVFSHTIDHSFYLGSFEVCPNTYGRTAILGEAPFAQDASKRPYLTAELIIEHEQRYRAKSSELADIRTLLETANFTSSIR